MFRALLWKDWRQLALVRWGGLAIGAVLPIAFTAGAELSQRGLLPTGTVKAYASRDLMYELLPAALGFGLWPLIALMSASQALAGDRAAGTESFLLERPVPRASVWRARFCASSINLFAVIAATTALAAIAAALTGAPPGVGWSRWLTMLSAGVGVALLAYAGGVAAASLLSSPLGAVLLGALLGAVPALLAAQLAAFGAYAKIGRVSLGATVPILLVPASIAASWIACCRGEPAGRGRIFRAVTLLGAAFVVVVAAFVALAPVVLRVNAGLGLHMIDPAPSGDGAFVGSLAFDPGERGGWIVNVATGAKLRFVPPPIRNIAWCPDGSEVAVLTWSGSLGSVQPDARIDIRSVGDGRVLRSIPVPGERVVHSFTWADAGLVAVVTWELSPQTRQLEVAIVDPISGAWHRTDFRSPGWSMALVGAGEAGRVYVRTLVDENTPVLSTVPRGYRLYPVDVAAAGVGPAVVDATGRPLSFAAVGDGISPSGRFARLVGRGAAWNSARLVDLTSALDVPDQGSPPWARWIQQDRLFWHGTLDHRSRMFVGPAGAQPKSIREWTDAAIRIDPSPGGRALFVSVLPEPRGAADEHARWAPDPSQFAGDVPRGSVPEELVYLPDDGKCVPLGPPFSARVNDQRYTQWAGAKTLARIAPGVVYFEDIDAIGKRRFVIGGVSDLE